MMSRGGLTNLFSFNKTSSSTSSSSVSIPCSSIPTSPHHTFSESIMEENIENAKSMITKWDPDSSSYTRFTFLFEENRKEAKDFIKCVDELRQAMHFLVLEKSGSDRLVLAQNLMEIAMKRLEKEFYQKLSANRQFLDSESVSGRWTRTSAQSQSRSSESDDEDYVGSDEDVKAPSGLIPELERLSELAMSDLKSISDCMIGSGYGTECVNIYKIIRRSIVDEELYRLGVERYNSSAINKMNSQLLEHHIKNWLNAVKIAVKTIFRAERILCDHVFSASDTIRESCFADVTKEGAINFFRFPELMAKSKRLPEKMHQLMVLYESISDLWQEIESIFSFESISAVRFQALNSLAKLGDSVQIMLSEFELSIQKNSSKTPVPGGGIHPLTNSVMNYLSLLSNYRGVLTDILTDSTPPTQSLLPESYLESLNSNKSLTPGVSVRLAWIILILLCKLDSKAEIYNDIALSYLFLANNLKFVTEEVRTTNLSNLLGDEWLAKHEKAVEVYAANYEAIAWTKVFSILPLNSAYATSAENVKGCFRQFNIAFQEVYKKRTRWVVPDRKLRDKIKVSIAKKLVPSYREFYDAHLATLSGERDLEVLVRFAPDDLENYLSDLFHGPINSGSSSSSHSRKSRWLS